MLLRDAGISIQAVLTSTVWLKFKCPYKYSDVLPANAARNAVQFPSKGGYISNNSTYVYYSQVQGQIAITQRKWCDFVIFTNKGVSVERFTGRT